MNPSIDINEIHNLIIRYKQAKVRDNQRKARGDCGWNTHAIAASRLGQRIAQAAQTDATAKAAVVAADLQQLYYYYTHDVSIFRCSSEKISEFGMLI